MRFRFGFPVFFFISLLAFLFQFSLILLYVGLLSLSVYFIFAIIHVLAF